MDRKIRTLLIDIDGVLYEGKNVVKGAPEALEWLKKHGYRCLLVTNTTRMSREEMFERLRGMGYSIAEEGVLTVPGAAVEFLKSTKPGAKCFVVGEKFIDEMLEKEGFKPTRKEEPVDFVFMSHTTSIDFDVMDSAFRLIMGGAEFVAMHADRFYPSTNKLVISLGVFVKGMEHATGKKAIIIGKPNPRFFELALKVSGGRKEETAMVGDSLEKDVLGAQHAGFFGILVKTGGFREEDLKGSKEKPNLVLESIADLPGFLEP